VRSRGITTFVQECSTAGSGGHAEGYARTSERRVVTHLCRSALARPAAFVVHRSVILQGGPMLKLQIIVGSTREGRHADAVLRWLLPVAKAHGAFDDRRVRLPQPMPRTPVPQLSGRYLVSNAVATLAAAAGLRRGRQAMRRSSSAPRSSYESSACRKTSSSFAVESSTSARRCASEGIQ
jgi:hypothetical protein